MQPTHAEVARTLAAGHLPATAHIACRQGPYPVRHVSDAQGRLHGFEVWANLPRAL